MRVDLGIEISNPGLGAGVALAAEGAREVLVERLDPPPPGPHIPGPRHDDRLMPAIDALFRRAGARPADLARVVVSVGPGGFTGLRVAVTTAKLLSEATGAACVPVPSADVAALLAWTAGGLRGCAPGARVGVALGSKGSTAYLSVFRVRDGQGPEPDGPGRLVSGDDPPTLDLLLGDEHLPQGLRDALTRAGVAIVRPELDPGVLLACAPGRAPVDPIELAPIYPREPEAVTKWRLLHPRSADGEGGVDSGAR